MKRLFFAFAAVLFIISACKKNDNADFAKKLLVGTWNNVNISTKAPTGKYLKLTAGGGVEGDVLPGYDSYEVTNNQLVLKGSIGTSNNIFQVSSDSLYIEPSTPCPGASCATLYARQK